MHLLVRLIYASQAIGPTSADLQAIEAVAQRHNREAGITGALVAAQGRYLQVLEGPCPAVEALYARIRQDPRHADCTLLAQTVADFRQWPDWSMQLIDPVAFEAEAISRHLDFRQLPNDLINAAHWIDLMLGFQCPAAPLPDERDEH